MCKERVKGSNYSCKIDTIMLQNTHSCGSCKALMRAREGTTLSFLSFRCNPLLEEEVFFLTFMIQRAHHLTSVCLEN